MKKIEPAGVFEGEFELPGDKSVTHRAIMFNGGAEGEAVITNALMGGDCLSTCQCMRALGAEIEIDGTTLRVRGTPHFRTGVRLNCGNSGTTMRLLTGFAAGKNIAAELLGDESLSSRPMARVAAPLSLLGADIRTTDGHAPVHVSPAPLRGTEVVLSIASAQVKSAVLLAGLSADGETCVREPQKTRDHTERMLAAMGADISTDGNAVRVKKSRLKAADVCVPADISSAAYFMALGALKGRTLSKNVGINPTRTGILTAFDRLGVTYSLLNRRVSGGEETADILVGKIAHAGDYARRGGRALHDRRASPRGSALRVCGRGKPNFGRKGAARQGERPYPFDDGDDRGARRNLRRDGGRVFYQGTVVARGRGRAQLSRSPHRHDGCRRAFGVRTRRQYRSARLLRHFLPRFFQKTRDMRKAR